MTKDERKLMLKIYSLMQIVREEINEYYIIEEIDRLSKKLEEALDK
jgi:hypothetical protein|nr:MAG TPA: hypothetical protein [Caudoviricetes sp.]